MSVRGVPEQDKPENQDPGVAYVLDEMTGETTPLEGAPQPEDDEDSKPKKRPAKKAAPKGDDKDTDQDDEEEGGDAGRPKPFPPAAKTTAPAKTTASADSFATRELGS